MEKRGREKKKWFCESHNNDDDINVLHMKAFIINSYMLVEVVDVVA